MKKLNQLYSIIISMILIIAGIFFVVNKEGFYSLIFFLIIVSLIIELYRKIIEKSFLSIIILLFLLISIFFYEKVFSVVFVLFGSYLIFTAIISLINYYIYRKNILRGSLSFLIRFITNTIVGLLLMFRVSSSRYILSLIAGIYLIVIGVIDIAKIVFKSLPNKYLDKLTFALPTLLTILLPQGAYVSIASLINAKKENNKVYKDNIEVLIHLKKYGPESFGHVDVAIDDYVYSYGLHDPKKRQLFGTLGDGVLLKVKKDEYINHCINQEGKIILSYVLDISNKQKEIIMKTLSELLDKAYIWKPDAEIMDPNNECYDYASRLFRYTNAKMYKFKKGKFKTYFVATTNCVQLSDYLIGSDELHLINIYGIITPGTYIQFLHEQYKNNKIVSSFNIYGNTSKDIKYNLKTINGSDKIEDFHTLRKNKSIDKIDAYATNIIIYENNNILACGRIYQNTNKDVIMDEIYAKDDNYLDIIKNKLQIIEKQWEKYD